MSPNATRSPEQGTRRPQEADLKLLAIAKRNPWALLESIEQRSHIMPPFPLPSEVAKHHHDVISFCSNLQRAFSASTRAPDASLSSQALADMMYIAILTHQGTRTLCEQGWTTVSSIILRTMLDMGANCMAIVKHTRPNYMGFKYLCSFRIKMAKESRIPKEQREEIHRDVEAYVARLNAEDQASARELIGHGKPRPYWFQPEFESAKKLLKLASVDIYPIYELLSGPAHGGWSGQAVFNDDPNTQDINPRAHPRWSIEAIKASSRLLLEIGYTRDGWEKLGFVDEYKRLVEQNTRLPKLGPQ
jgi:hypothetical protein